MFNLKVLTISIFFFFLCVSALFAQNITQTIRGKVIDTDSKTPLKGARVIIMNLQPPKGAIAKDEGEFVIEHVPLGRYNLQATFIGYKPAVIPEALVGSAKEVYLTFELKESSVQTGEITVTPEVRKDLTLNSMSLIGGRAFSVEETRRYAGGWDDPLRVVSNFAGVAGSSDIGKNAIIVRGNSPKGMLWRIDGVDVPNPNHFSWVGQSGGGVTIFSSQLLSNSDFYTSAYPAEYGNALAGVFDMNFRTGNFNKREHTVQLGVQGIDIASEGPFSEGSPSSYLFNYRYSTLGFISKIHKDLMKGVPDYQDLSFKINIPTKGAGVFSIMGIGGIARQISEPDEDDLKEIPPDREKLDYMTMMGATAISNNLIVGEKSFLHTSLSVTGDNLESNNSFVQPSDILDETESVSFLNWKATFETYLNHKFNAGHTNKTGFKYSRLFYAIDISETSGEPPITEQFVDSEGNSYLIQFFSESRFDLNDAFSFNFGAYFQYFGLNKHYSIEPRLSVKWNINEFQSLSFGYGMHSQLENLGIYLAEAQGNNDAITLPNKDLDFSKAHHLVLGYDQRLTENSRIRIEPYFQYLYNIPVIEGNYFSMLNYTGGYQNDKLVNKGSGMNYGLDITVERFLNDGYYYLLTASLFESKYKGGDGKLRNSRFNSNFVINALYGMEFRFGESKLLGLNLKTTVTGGEFYVPIDLEQSRLQNKKVYDETQAFNKRFDTFYYLDFTATYRINYSDWALIFALQAKNLLNQQTVSRISYDKYKKEIDEDIPMGITPMFSIKAEF